MLIFVQVPTVMYYHTTLNKATSKLFNKFCCVNIIDKEESNTEFDWRPNSPWKFRFKSINVKSLNFGTKSLLNSTKLFYNCFKYVHW